MRSSGSLLSCSGRFGIDMLSKTASSSSDDGDDTAESVAETTLYTFPLPLLSIPCLCRTGKSDPAKGRNKISFLLPITSGTVKTQSPYFHFVFLPFCSRLPRIEDLFSCVGVSFINQNICCLKSDTKYIPHMHHSLLFSNITHLKPSFLPRAWTRQNETYHSIYVYAHVG